MPNYKMLRDSLSNGEVFIPAIERQKKNWTERQFVISYDFEHGPRGIIIHAKAKDLSGMLYGEGCGYISYDLLDVDYTRFKTVATSAANQALLNSGVIEMDEQTTTSMDEMALLANTNQDKPQNRGAKVMAAVENKLAK